jgi:hypothetical protein
MEHANTQKMKLTIIGSLDNLLELLKKLEKDDEIKVDEWIMSCQPNNRGGK